MACTLTYTTHTAKQPYTQYTHFRHSLIEPIDMYNRYVNVPQSEYLSEQKVQVDK